MTLTQQQYWYDDAATTPTTTILTAALPTTAAPPTTKPIGPLLVLTSKLPVTPYVPAASTPTSTPLRPEPIESSIATTTPRIDPLGTPFPPLEKNYPSDMLAKPPSNRLDAHVDHAIRSFEGKETSSLMWALSHIQPAAYKTNLGRKEPQQLWTDPLGIRPG
eukprot:jgi/Psemu1/50516/gm1.50516_g